MVSRVDRGPVANWWWTIDRFFLAACLALMGLGILLSFAASPAVAQRIGLDGFHFVERQIFFMLPAVGVAAPDQAICFDPARHFACIDGCRTVLRYRSERCAALGQSGRDLYPAVRIHEACIRGGLRLAVLGA